MEEKSDAFAMSQESRANGLYWDSERSVNSIAEELDLSRGALYALIRPLASGLLCPECGGELQYPNRTARERRLVTCESCGYQESEAVVREIWSEREDAGGLGKRMVGSSLPREAWGAGLLMAAAVLAVSASLFYAFKRRRT